MNATTEREATVHRHIQPFRQEPNPMDHTTLQPILARHAAWLNGHTGGARADLTGAVLTGAVLTGADLTDADLTDADLTGAVLRGADLTGADLSWDSHDILSEILLRASGEDVEKRKIAGLVLISRDWCWKDFMKIETPLRDWALTELAGWVNGDEDINNIPAPLRPLVTAKREAGKEGQE